MATVNNGKLQTKKQQRRLLKDFGPSTQGSSYASWVKWGDWSNWLGQPFDMTRVPLSKLHQMRCDPMIAFGLLFSKIPIIRASWSIECEDPRIAGFVDGALRSIYARFIFAYLNC